MPASATEGTGLPDVVILNLSGLPAATAGAESVTRLAVSIRATRFMAL